MKSDKFSKMLEVASSSSSHGGVEEHRLALTAHLLAQNPTAGPPDDVRAVQEGREQIPRATNYRWCLVMACMSHCLSADQCLEALGDDDLAEYDCKTSLER